jgi:hypothetical protein
MNFVWFMVLNKIIKSNTSIEETNTKKKQVITSGTVPNRILIKLKKKSN